MRFKIDENLPPSQYLRGVGFGADIVGRDELSGAEDAVIVTTSRSEDRILITLDLDFANIRAYPPGEHAGMILPRMNQQDKRTVLA